MLLPLLFTLLLVLLPSFNADVPVLTLLVFDFILGLWFDDKVMSLSKRGKQGKDLFQARNEFEVFMKGIRIVIRSDTLDGRTTITKPGFPAIVALQVPPTWLDHDVVGPDTVWTMAQMAALLVAGPSVLVGTRSSVQLPTEEEMG